MGDSRHMTNIHVEEGDVDRRWMSIFENETSYCYLSYMVLMGKTAFGSNAWMERMWER